MRYLYIRVRDWFLYDMKLRSKFFAVYIICMFVPLIVLSVFSFTATGNEINSHTLESVAAMIAQTRDFVTYRLNSVIEAANTVYLDAGLYEYLSGWESAGAAYNTDLIENKLATLAAKEDIHSVNLYLLNAPRIPKSNYCKSIASARSAAWYRALLNNEEANSVWLYSPAGVCFYYAKKIFSKYDKNRLIGYIAVTINQNVVTDLLRNVCYTTQSIACVTDARGELVLSMGAKRDNLRAELREIDQTRWNDGPRDVALSGRVYCAVRQPLTRYSLSSLPHWDIMLLCPRDELFASNTILFRNMILTALAGVVMLMVVVSRIIREITRRMDNLNDNMKRVQDGGFSDNAVPVGKDELSVLQANFNYMVVKTNQFFRQAVEAEERARESELSLLQSQINPHFLYNTLDVINWAAQSAGCAEISETTIMLAKFYRMSLRRGVSIVTLADELTHIALYVGLQNKRFDGCIALEDRVPEEHRNCAALKLMLQPIVENAILHGLMEKSPPGGRIVIASERRDDRIVIVIADDGCGMDDETMARLNRMDDARPASGFGVYNTMQRIAYCYGAGYGLRYGARPGGGVAAEMVIPFIPYGDEMLHMSKLVNHSKEMQTHV